jgi:hypothetical protein
MLTTKSSSRMRRGAAVTGKSPFDPLGARRRICSGRRRKVGVDHHAVEGGAAAVPSGGKNALCLFDDRLCGPKAAPVPIVTRS